MIIALLGLTALVIGATVVIVQMRRGRFFTLLTLYTALFILEVPGGALKALRPDIFPDYSANDTSNPLPFVPAALVVGIAGYLVFLYGYLCVAWLARTKPGHKEEVTERFFDRWWTPSFKVLLFFMTLFAMFAGFVQHWARIRAAGGLQFFLENAYALRAGTATAGAGETALVVMANLVAGSAVPLMLVWMFAWLRGRLSLFEKFVVVNLFALLLLRQWSTMFRTVLIFTLVAMFAAYVSERRVKLRQWVLVGGTIFAVLVAANFVHLYMYYLTAGWSRYGLAESMAQLIAPHGHVYSLSYIVDAERAGGHHLGGKGFLESFFFFIPRAVWQTKLESTSYGTMLVQEWAGLPTHYQMAITATGEWLAHFGWLGIAGMTLFGALYARLDSFFDRGVVARAALFGIALARVLSDSGMGISAIAITIFCLAVFFGEMFVVMATVWLGRRILAVPRALLRPGPRQVIQEGR